MKRINLASQRTKGKWTCPDTKLLKDYPQICEHLFDNFHEDGKVRETSTLTVRGNGANVRVSLNEQNIKASITSDATTLTEALTAIEGLLTGDSAPWRVWKGR